MKRLLYALSIAAVAGILWGSVTPAAACSCGAEDEESFARVLLDYSPVVVVGRIMDTSSEYTQLDVEATYKGELMARITLDQTQKEVEMLRENAARYGYAGMLVDGPGDCTVTLLGEPGQRYLLGLAKSEKVDGAYAGSLCATAPETPVTEYWNWPEMIRSLQEASGDGLTPGGLPADAGMPDEATFPKLPAAIAATLGPLAFLAGAAFVWRRGERHSG